MLPLDMIWRQAQTGDRLGAKKELAHFLHEQPDNVQAWLLMATLLDEPGQQAECYRKALNLDPQNHRAKTMLQQITTQEAPQESVSEAAPPSSPPVQIPELFEYTAEGEIDEERLAALMREDLAKYVARELGSSADRNTLIRHICETGDMSWPEAEAFVARVALENEHEIAKRQSPLMLVLSVGTMIGGAFFVLTAGFVLIEFLSGELRARLDFAFYGIVTGLAMLAGGLIGLVRTLKSLRDTGE